MSRTPEGAGPQGVEALDRRLLHRQRHERDARHHVGDQPDGLRAGELGQEHRDEDHIRGEVERFGDGLGPAGGLSHDLEALVLLERSRQGAANEVMLIADDDPNRVIDRFRYGRRVVSEHVTQSAPGPRI